MQNWVHNYFNQKNTNLQNIALLRDFIVFTSFFTIY